MGVPSQFLTLSIKEQLFITILILTIFSVLVILCLPGSFSYEILMEDYKKKKRFFYNEYKEYIEACFYFQSFTILKYEEIIKRMAKQIYKYNRKENVFNITSDFKDTYNKTYPVQDLLYNDINDENILYKYCYNTDEACNKYENMLIDKLQDKYDSLNGLIFSHDIGNRFKIPGFAMPIINSFFGINVNDSVMFGFGKDWLNRTIANTSDFRNVNKNLLNYYYKQVVNQTIDEVKYNLYSFSNLNLFLFKELFTKILKEMTEIDEINALYTVDRNNTQEYTKAYMTYIKAATGYYSTIELANDKCFLTSYNNYDDKFYYYQFNLITGYLYIINRILTNELNMNFIPLYSMNHSIISPELCTIFLMRQSNDLFNEKKLNETYNNIHKWKSLIDDCIYDKKILENKKIREMLDTNITHFLRVSNKIYQGLIELNEPYFFMKYSFPNLNILKEFVSDYLLLDQVDFYLFASFKEPIEYANYIKKQYQNLFYLMMIFILYIWVICFIVNMIIYCKVAKQITEPIYKLQEAIETSNLKDESVFKYEYDDIINELFITCKELLTGQIDPSNNLKYSGQFNILNNKDDKDNVVDKSKYEKNLIINNEIVNQLINEQQNMMNFGNEIDINADSTINDINNDIIEEEIEERNDKRKNSNFSRAVNNNEDKENQENIDDINKQNKIQEEEDRDKRSYKSLFKLAQYLYYYRCKVEENNITININSNSDDKKSNISKFKNQGNNQKHKKSLSKGGAIDKNEENITINVLKGKDLTYLWYMEMKKKNNKSFNYELSDDYEELFMDFYTNKNS